MALLEDSGFDPNQYAPLTQPLPLAPPAAGPERLDPSVADSPTALMGEPEAYPEAAPAPTMPSVAEILRARRDPAAALGGPARASDETKAATAEAAGQDPNRYDRALEAIYAAGTGKPLDAGYFSRAAQAGESEKNRRAQLLLALNKQRNPTTDPLLDLKRQKLMAEVEKLKAGGAEDPVERDALLNILSQPRYAGYVEKIGGPEALKGLGAKALKEQMKFAFTAMGADEGARKNHANETYREWMGEANIRNKNQKLDLDRLKLGEDQTRLAHSYLHDHDTSKPMESLKDIDAGLKEIEAIAPGMPRGITQPVVDPKTGVTEEPLSVWSRALAKIPGGVGTWANTVDQNRLNQAYGIIQQKIIRPMAGANLTENEVKQFQKIFGDSLAGDPKMMAVALDLFRNYVGRRLRAEEAQVRGKVGEDVWNVYKGWGSLTSEDPMYADVTKPFQPQARDVRSIVNERLRGGMGDTAPANSTPPSQRGAPPAAPAPEAAPPAGPSGIGTPEQIADLERRAAAAPSKTEADDMVAQTRARKALAQGESLMGARGLELPNGGGYLLKFTKRMADGSTREVAQRYDPAGALVSTQER